MRVYRKTRKTKDGQRKQAAKWSVEFKDHLDTVRRLTAFTDKRQSEELGRKIERLLTARMAKHPIRKWENGWSRCLATYVNG